MFMLACGFFVKASNIPDWWIWLYYISFHRYAFEIFMYNEFTGLIFPCDPLVNGTYYCAYPNESDHPSYLTGMQVLDNYGYQDVKMWQWFLVLLAMLLFFRICFYLALRFYNKGKR
jgi:ABC-type multidrug transport system permease subunit